MNMVKVALAEDNVLLREGISRLVAANEDFELVGVASDLPQLLALAAERVPDVVVTDIRMPPTGTDEGIQAASWLRQHYPRTGVVVLSQYVAPKYAVALLEHGSAGRAYLLKERVGSVDELARAIRAVSRDMPEECSCERALTSSSTTMWSITEPPAATVRMARASSSTLPTRSLSRYARPAEPCSRSATAYFGATYWLSTTTPVRG